MLQLTTKWMTNTLAKKSIYNNDYIQCADNKRLYIIGVGKFTSSCKMTFNYEVRDEYDNVISNGNDAYLDALTKIILGATPKSQENKKKSEETKGTKGVKQASKQGQKECLYLTFDEAFEMACNAMQSYKSVATMLGTYKGDEAIRIALIIQEQARENERARIKEIKKNEELNALRMSLDIAKQQGNSALIDAINDMIAKKENE